MEGEDVRLSAHIRRRDSVAVHPCGWIDLPPRRGFAFLACAQKRRPSDRWLVPCVLPVAERD